MAQGSPSMHQPTFGLLQLPRFLNAEQCLGSDRGAWRASFDGSSANLTLSNGNGVVATAPTPLKVTHAASCTTEQPTLTLQLPTVAASTLLVGGIDVAAALTQLMSTTGGGDTAGGTDPNTECGTNPNVQWLLGAGYESTCEVIDNSWVCQSCDEICNATGGRSCDANALAIDFTKGCLEALVEHLGETCWMTEKMMNRPNDDVFYGPQFKREDGNCVGGNATTTGDCASQQWAEGRICPCSEHGST